MRGTEVHESQKAKSPRLMTMLGSPVGRKLLTGVTGIALALFVLVHMLGNLGYYSTDPDAYNKYSDFLLHGVGPVIYVIEIVLLVAFLLHAYLGVKIWMGKRAARGRDYETYKSAGKPSLQTFSSRTMIITGIVLLVFTVIHLLSFKFGPGVTEGYISTLDDGTQIRDLKRLVTDRFQSPVYAFGYTAVMLLLGFHLRHGFWSMLQSLGAMNPRLTPVIYTIGTIFAILVAVGFLALPLYIYFTGGGGVVALAM